MRRGAVVPVQVTGIADATVVARGVSAACVARANGQIACRGDADSGPLGSDLRLDVATPTAVPLSCTP